ncbi:hypothetical protein ACFP2T_26490 [Plantactinospora solaniradicis]|uniref:Uncharacterized protein n=1 Tax=Plantactinospora solaniradicis TaxID=1723736 RepID=A0ABW1KG14_9ACTN
MPAADPSERPRQPFRAFVGRHQGLIGTTLFVVLGGGGIAAWHRWDLWWLENSLVQALLIGIASVGMAVLFFWGEGGLPGTAGRSRPRRPRAERETARPHGWRRSSGRRSVRRRRAK